MMVELNQSHLSKIHREHVTLLGLWQSYDIQGLRQSLADHLSVS